MPYTLKPSKIHVKDPNSTGYLPQNVITEESTQEQLSQIQTAGTNQVNAINTQGSAKVSEIQTKGAAQVSAIESKGAQTLDSIPSDYTTLQGEVSDLKSAISANQDALVDGILEQPLIWETGSISTSTGQEADNSNYKRTRGYIRYYTGATLYNGSDTAINVLAYNDDYTFNASKSYTLSPNGSYTTEDADQIYYMRIRVSASATNIDSITFVKNTGIYTSIEELRTVQEKIEEGILSGNIEIEPAWSVGSISSSTGADATNNNFKRTDYILATTETKVKNESDTSVFLFGYSGNTSETFISPAVVVAANTEYEIPSEYKYIRLRVTSDFDVADITLIGNHIYNKQEIQEIAGSQGGKAKTTQKLAVIGDSLSDTDYHTSHKWMYFLSEYDGYNVTNLAVSGSSYFNGSNKGGTSDHQFYNQATLVPNDTDIVLVFGSFNDIGFLYRGEVTMGTVDDTGTTTIGGCFNRMLSNLYAINPGMKIGIVIPTPWAGYNPGMAESNQYYQSVMDYVAFLEEICKYNSIPFMNLFYESGMRPWNADFRNLYYWEADGTHPNEAGQLNYIYPKMREFLRKLNCQNI